MAFKLLVMAQRRWRQLAHVVRNPVEAAYGRSDLFERRRRLMDDWAGYLVGRDRKREVARAAARPAVSRPPAAAW